MARILFAIFSLTLINLGRAQTPDSLRISSPNGLLTWSIGLRDLPESPQSPVYEITYRNQLLIQPSRLGLGGNPAGSRPLNWDKNLRIVSATKRSQQANWKPVWGERAEIPDHYNELVVSLRNGPGSGGTMQLIVRAYDEGVAFRYFFPEDLRMQILDVGQEMTFFNLPPKTKALYTDHAQGSYEERNVENWTKAAQMPLTLKLDNGTWACITQAEQSSYPLVRLKTAGLNQLVSQLAGEITEASPFASSWRVVMAADRPGDLLEHNYLIQNLNPPNEIKDVSWIKPGKVMREVTLSTTGAKNLVDFAVEQNIDYLHFDAGWYGHEYEIASDATRVSVDPRRNPKGDLDLPEAIRYAKSKGKKVILYVNHRALERQLDTLLPLYQRWGVAGIKYGFVHTGSHHWTVWLHDAIRKAAKHHLVLDIHDEYSPTGFSRTYPNLLTQEGVRGNEEWPNATHNTVLPFTRYIAGAADYTFCFNQPRLTNTKGHQLALPVIYFSPLQYLYWYGKPADFPDRQEIEFWKDLPTVWDETKVLDGTPGQYVSVARRKGNDWFLGTITSTEARKIDLSLAFLEPGKQYSLSVYEDDGTGKIRKQTRTVTSKDRLTANLLPSGGQAVVLKRN
ncbi:glycoside hydrolase family 97 protein [Larkinella humicola]|uniref:Glycoside hydrolase family 97 protein n=1 Tax=Larkinella humicola TaxID=2607654 RepID=A0A5N1J772_9BACT|nr:glycoside hydrolase family 97 protein [Larkinella humicola]KAA9346638.1 glycoside hydrolase family 97 protein [Larkinella humicola]